METWKKLREKFIRGMEIRWEAEKQAAHLGGKKQETREGGLLRWGERVEGEVYTPEKTCIMRNEIN